MYRIAIIGPESSGKTTLAKALAAKLHATLIEEYSREYFKLNDYSKCSLHDLEIIAQNQFDNSKISTQKSFLISDTEMLTMEIWAKDKYSEIPMLISELRKKQDFDLYILSKPDFPWHYDPLRTDCYRRDQLFEMYKQEIMTLNYKYLVVKGNLSERISSVKDYLHDVFPNLSLKL